MSYSHTLARALARGEAIDPEAGDLPARVADAIPAAETISAGFLGGRWTPEQVRSLIETHAMLTDAEIVWRGADRPAVLIQTGHSYRTPMPWLASALEAGL